MSNTSGTSSVLETARSAAAEAGLDPAKLAQDVGAKLKDVAESQKHAGAEKVLGVARAIRNAAGDIEQESPEMARYVRSAASTIESFTRDFDDRSVDDLGQAVVDMARRSPGLFFAGSMLAGFALFRFLNAAQGAAMHGPGRQNWSSRRGSSMEGGAQRNWQQRSSGQGQGGYGSSSAGGYDVGSSSGSSSSSSASTGSSSGSSSGGLGASSGVSGSGAGGSYGGTTPSSSGAVSGSRSTSNTGAAAGSSGSMSSSSAGGYGGGEKGASKPASNPTGSSQGRGQS